MIWFNRCDSRLTICTRFLSSSSSGASRANSFNSAGHRRERLANFVRDGRGKPSQRGHAFLGGHFLFEALEVGEVLKIENVTAVPDARPCAAARSKCRESAAGPSGSKLDFALRKRLRIFLLVHFNGPEIRRRSRRHSRPRNGLRSRSPVISAPARFSSRMRPSRSVVSRPPRMESMMSWLKA